MFLAPFCTFLKQLFQTTNSHHFLGLFANELIDYYNSINQEEEKTLLQVFIMARGDPDRAEQLVRQLDPNLYKSYSQVFPPYYSKLNGLSPETYKFYKHTVTKKHINFLNHHFLGFGQSKSTYSRERLSTRRLQTFCYNRRGMGKIE